MALLLGMVGALFGGYRSYSNLQSMLPATLNNYHLRQDANAEPVQQTIRAARAYDARNAPDFIPAPIPGFIPDTTPDFIPDTTPQAKQPATPVPDFFPIERPQAPQAKHPAAPEPDFIPMDEPDFIPIEHPQAPQAKQPATSPPIDPGTASDMFKAGVNAKILGISPSVAYRNADNPQAKTPHIDPQTGERLPQAKAAPSKKQYYDPVAGKPISNPTPPNDEWEAGITTSHGFFTPSEAKCHAILGQPVDAFIDGHPMLVCWDKNYTVVSFEAQQAFPFPYELKPESSAWEYCWCAFLPVLGFFIPWLAVRLVAWALAGFAAYESHRPTS